MRWVFVNQYFPPDGSGSARLLSDLAQFAALSHEVTVVCGTPSYNPIEATNLDGAVRVLRVKSLSGHRKSLLARTLNYTSFMARALRKLISIRDADIVIGLTDPPFIGLLAALAARRHRVPYVQIYLDIWPDIGIALKKLDNRIVVQLWRFGNNWARKHSSLVIAVARDMRFKLIREGLAADKVRFCTNWGSGKPLTPEAERAIRLDHGWSGKFVVMFCGNLGLAQGLEQVVEAAWRLRDRDDIRFVFLGDGAKLQDLIQIVSYRAMQNVEFIPLVERTEAERLMSVADLHLVTLAPGLGGCAAPGKLYSILACGKPFVAAVDAGMEPSLIAKEFECGWHAPPGDAKAIADAIRMAVDAPLKAMGVRSRRAYEHSFNPETVIPLWIKEIETIGNPAR